MYQTSDMYLFFFGANLKLIQKAAIAVANALCSFILQDIKHCSQPQRKRLLYIVLFSSTIISQGNIRDGAQNDPRG